MHALNFDADAKSRDCIPNRAFIVSKNEGTVCRINEMFCGVVLTYTLNLEGLVPSGPPTIDMLLILTSDVNLQHSTWTKFELHNPKVLKTFNPTK